MACGLCPGNGNIWLADVADTVDVPFVGVAIGDPIPIIVAGQQLGDFGGAPGEEAWAHIANVDTWDLQSDVTEATKKRTSSTCGLEVKFCPDIVEFDMVVTVTLCPTDWIFCYLFNQNPGAQNRFWGFAGWGETTNWDCPLGVTGPSKNTDAAIRAGHTDPGIYFQGSLTPGGFTFDNTSTDPVTTEFSISVDYLIFPDCTVSGGKPAVNI